MTTLTVINSSFDVSITLQYWNSDSWVPMMEMLGEKGFLIDPSQPSQPYAMKDATTYFRVEVNNRRIIFKITNNIISPNTNLEEILDILSLIGFTPEDSIDRIDIHGNIVIKINNGSTSDFVSQAIKNPISIKIDEIFDKSAKVAGVRIISSEYHLEDSSKSPFAILIEPLLTDKSKTKFFIQTMFATSNSQDATRFLESLYDKLKKIIIELENEHHSNSKDIQ